MKIDESQAIDIAKRYVQDELADGVTDIDFDNCNALLDEEGYGNMALGIDEDFWLVTFLMKTRPDNIGTYEPEYMTVMVGVDSGEAYWIPEMI